MRFSSILTFITLTAGLASAALNGSCSVNGTPGVCIKTATCSSGGGKSTSGFCPNDPADVKCCTKTSCGSGGNCRWTSQCSGTTVSNKCPGPSGFKCCQPKSGGGGGGGGIPTIPTNKCKSHVVANGKKILAKFPGKVHTVWCYANKSGDHGKGLALDLMVKNRSAEGKTIAQYVVDNHKSLGVQYVIYGQRIWNVSREGSPKPWAQWRLMENRGSDTANHWDHPHVSFKA